MKKVLSFAIALFSMTAVMAQTIVSTAPQNRNAIIEELTGINCVWCPAGHKVVNEIIEAYPGRVVGINVHAGYFSQGSPYNTTYGTAYDNQANPDGYPAGTVNRHVFQNLEPGTTALGRGDFEQAAQTIMGMPSPVNVAAVGRVNEAARQVELHVEIYYTGNSSVETNYLNIAVLQNNVLGPQTGGEANYPEMMVNGQYRHMHMLREMLTDTWGEAIPATQGTFIDTTIIWNVPQAIGSVPIDDLANLDFVVFVAEGHQEIITGVKAVMITEKPSMSSFKVYQVADCSLEYQPYVTINNSTESDLHNFTFEYDGASYTVNKTIPSLSVDTINMPLHVITVSGDAVQNCAATKTVSLVSCLNEDNETIQINSDAMSLTFAEFSIYSVAGPMLLCAAADGYGTECSVSLVNQSNCNVEWTWHDASWTNIGPQSAQYISQLYDGRKAWYRFNPSTPGLYILRVNDAYGDGWNWTNNTNPSGIWLDDANGSVIADAWGYSNCPTFSAYDYYLNVTTSGDGSHVDIEDVANMVKFNVSPNPATDRLTINCSEAVREINVLDMTGRTVMTTATTSSINVSALAAGVYVVRIATENGIGMQKFVKE